MSIREQVNETIAALDNEHDAWARLPYQARNVIAGAYNAIIDIQCEIEESALNIDSANEYLAEECQRITDYVNAANLPREVSEEIGRIVRPINELSSSLNYAQAYGE